MTMKLISKKMFASLPLLPRSKYLLILLTLGSSFSAPVAQAQTNHQRWYQVELIVFARQTEDNQEHWPTDIRLSYPLNWVELKEPADTSAGEPVNDINNETFESKPQVDLLRDPFYFLPDSEKNLSKYAAALSRDSRFRVLFHEAWRQFIGGRKNAPALLISGGDSYGNHHELEGTITLSVAQYLQLQTNLWLSQFEINYGQAPGEWPQLPKMPNKIKAEFMAANAAPGMENSEEDATAFKLRTAPNTLGSDDMLATLSEPYITKKIVVMKQERRMRSNELHYIDHPLFGLIVKITQYDLPKDTSMSEENSLTNLQ